MYEEKRKKAEKHRGFFLVVFPAAIMLIYLGCECFHDFSGVLYYLYPALMKGLMLYCRLPGKCTNGLAGTVRKRYTNLSGCCGL